MDRASIWELDETWEPFRSILVSELVALGFSDDDSERMSEVVITNTRRFCLEITKKEIEDKSLENALRAFMKEEYAQQVIENRCFLRSKP